MFRTAAASNQTAGAGGVGDLAAPGHGPAFQHPDTFQHVGDVSNTSIGTLAAVNTSGVGGGDVTHHSTKRGQSKYPFRMNFYLNRPTQGFAVTMDEFETWALDRLRGK